MAYQAINVGTIADDHTGDPGRTAFQKVNANFTELYAGGPYSILTYGAVGDGTTDDSGAISSAISAAVAAGGGTVVFPPGKTYAATSSITLQSQIILSGYGATLKYTGSGFAISTAATGTTNNAGILGLTINPTSVSAGALSLNSTYQCQFRDIYVTSAAAGVSNVIFQLGTNTSGTNNPTGNLNNVFNIFDSLVVDSQFGTGLKLIGSDSNHVVTDNTFINLVFEGGASGGAVVYGIEFNQWCDSNVFSGFTLVRLYQTSPANGIGVAFGTSAIPKLRGVLLILYSNAMVRFSMPLYWRVA